MPKERLYLDNAGIEDQPSFGILIRRPAQDVWDFVMDLPQTPKWRPRMSNVEWLEDGEPQVGSRFRVWAKVLGYTFKFNFEVTIWSPPHRFGYRQLTGPVAIDSFMLLTEHNDGCRFMIGGNPQANGLLMKLVEPLLWGTLAKQNGADLIRLKQHLEIDSPA